ncbi:hypothetical protein FP2506_08441 [Fulvimarina pelagi HTCC2506]|uniref:Uncharacterized protein n=1 Tax=Fulvimarina pelagi HTCC2506 TaxID=314231 RepID=Q0G658_9HYPH|nr:hypothetical protein FP2506_08441 [Fulvimarina pelagi HTCC2506]
MLFRKWDGGQWAAVFESLCSGEGMSWFGWFVFERSGDTLRRTDWLSDPAQALSSPRFSEFKRCSGEPSNR